MLDQLCRHWSLSNPRLLAATATSHVWQVTQANGTEAALKLLHEAEVEELAGFDLLQSWAGHGAVHIYARQDRASLRELCPDPSLCDMVRAGHDTLATQTLCRRLLRAHDHLVM